MSLLSGSSKANAPAAPSAPAVPVTESLFSRVIVAPVLFVSFLISLFLIDRKTYGVVSSHENDHDSDRNNQRHASRSPHPQQDGYYRSNKRKLARQEMEEAFQLRSKVIAGIALLSGIGLALVGWGGQRLLTSMLWSTPQGHVWVAKH